MPIPRDARLIWGAVKDGVQISIWKSINDDKYYFCFEDAEVSIEEFRNYVKEFKHMLPPDLHFIIFEASKLVVDVPTRRRGGVKDEVEVPED